MVSSFAYAVESGQAEAAKTTLRQNTNWQTAFELAAKAIEPSVVTITLLCTVHQGEHGDAIAAPVSCFFGNESPFFGFFDNLPHNLHQEGLGSGVIVSADGYILTNNHVVNGADQLTVQLSDNREFKAKVIGTDPKTDVAVINSRDPESGLLLKPDESLPLAEVPDADAARRWHVANRIDGKALVRRRNSFGSFWKTPHGL